jgi:hypothetical protein
VEGDTDNAQHRQDDTDVNDGSEPETPQWIANLKIVRGIAMAKISYIIAFDYILFAIMRRWIKYVGTTAALEQQSHGVQNGGNVTLQMPHLHVNDIGWNALISMAEIRAKGVHRAMIDFSERQQQLDSRVRKQWNSQHVHRDYFLPSYYRMSMESFYDLVDNVKICVDSPIASISVVVVFFLAVVLGLGQFISKVGRRYWSDAFKRYCIFGLACFGVWTEE